MIIALNKKENRTNPAPEKGSFKLKLLTKRPLKCLQTSWSTICFLRSVTCWIYIVTDIFESYFENGSVDCSKMVIQDENDYFDTLKGSVWNVKSLIFFEENDLE